MRQPPLVLAADTRKARIQLDSGGLIFGCYSHLCQKVLAYPDSTSPSWARTDFPGRLQWENCTFNPTISTTRRFTSKFSSCLDKLFATMHTVTSSFASTYSVFLFTTLSNEDSFVDHCTTDRAKAHRSICSPVIKVGALLSLPYHFLLPAHLCLQTLRRLCNSITQFVLKKMAL